MQSPARLHLNTKNRLKKRKIKINLFFIVFERRSAMRNKPEFTSEEQTRLYPAEEIVPVFYILTYNVLFFLNILPN